MLPLASATGEHKLNFGKQSYPSQQAELVQLFSSSRFNL
jgi:hypothetical protein